MASFFKGLFVVLMLLVVVQFILWLCGTGFMQLFKLPYDYDYGYALGGSSETTLVSNQEITIRFKGGVNLTFLLAASAFLSLVISIIT